MKKPIVLFGDSLTAGRIGIAYSRYLPFPVTARGIEGDTWVGVASRSKRFLTTKRSVEEPTVVIQGGANDLLLTFRPQAKHLINAKTPPYAHDDEFAGIFSDMLFAIEQAHPTIPLIICSLPIIGEDLSSELNERRRQRNELLESLVSHSAGALWCDIASPLEALIMQEKEKHAQNVYFINDVSNFASDAAYIGDDEDKAAEISRQRNLIVTIDGIHPNSIGAKAIAKALTPLLSQ